MKRIIIFLLLFAALKVAGQTTGYFRYDTVKIMKQNGTCELYIINKTKDSLGLLTNVGGGLTRFIKSKVINDSTIVIGLDTLVLPGNSGSFDNSIATGSRTATGEYTQDWAQRQLITNNIRYFRNSIQRPDAFLPNNIYKMDFYLDSGMNGRPFNFDWALRNAANDGDSIRGTLGTTETGTYIFNGLGDNSRYGNWDFIGNSNNPRLNGTLSSDSKFSQYSLGHVATVNPNDSIRAKLVSTPTATKVVTARAEASGVFTLGVADMPAGGSGEANTSSNVGAGVGLAKEKVGVDLPFKSLTSDTNLIWTANTNDAHVKVAPNTLNYINYLNRPVPFSNGSIFLGNSITYGYNEEGGTLKSWPTYLKDYLNLSAITNLAISGSGARRGYKQLSENLNPNAIGPLGTMVGFNNVRGTTDTAHVFELVRASHRAMAALLFANPASMNFYIMGSSGSVNSNISTSQTCGSCTASSEATLQDYGSRTYYYRHNDPANSSSNWWLKSSLVANETVTISNVGGSGIVVGTWAATTGWSRIEVRIDGDLKTTYDPNGRVGTYWADGFTTNGITNDAIVVLGLRDTLHTVELKFLDGSATGGFDYVAGIKSAITCLSTPMYVMDLPHMNATGYAYPGGEVTEAQLDSCSESRFRDLQYYFPGYPIYRVNTNKYFDPNDPLQEQADGIHLKSLGQWNVARAVIDEMGPKWLMNAGGGAGSLDATLAIGNTSARRLLLTGSNSSNSNFEVGSDIAAQVYAPSNSWLASNLKFDGSNFVYLHNGAATQLYLNNGGYTEYKNAASGSTGGTATVNTRMTITPGGDVWAGGPISSSVDGTGATLKVYSNGNVDIAGNTGIGGNATISGNASAVGTISVPSYISMGNSFSGTAPLRLSNYGGAGGSQPTIIYYNAAGGTNEKYSDITLGSGTISFRLLNDAFNAANDWMTVTRSGYTSANIAFPLGNVAVTGDATVADEAYDATSWNGSTEVPTKNAVRDKIESLGAGNGIYGGSGSLPSAVTITGGNNKLTMTGTQATLYAFNVDNTGNGGGISGTTTGSGYAMTGFNSGSGAGVFASSNSGTGIISQSTGGKAGVFRSLPSSTNTIVDVVDVIRGSTGTPAAGIGARLNLKVATSAGNEYAANYIESKWTTATDGSEVGEFSIWGRNSGVNYRRFSILGTGQFQMPYYGAGTFTGTPTGTIQVTSGGDVIEGPLVASGTWSPTLTDGTNSSGATVGAGRYTRVGNIVTFSLTITTTTSAGASATTVTATLPVASDFTTTSQASGTNSGLRGSVTSNTSDILNIDWVSNTGGTETITITGQYIIL